MTKEDLDATSAAFHFGRLTSPNDLGKLNYKMRFDACMSTLSGYEEVAIAADEDEFKLIAQIVMCLTKREMGQAKCLIRVYGMERMK